MNHELGIYSAGIWLYRQGIRLAALKNRKARLLDEGLKQTFATLRRCVDPYANYVWIHAASLGEFEQARPIIELFKAKKPEYKILLTFFSPSGYEVRKDYPLADVVCYMPMDTPRNVAKLLDIVNPAMAIFVKYEFWGNYLKALHRRDIPTYLVSGIFRHDQLFFKPYGGWYRNLLRYFTHLFVQDRGSESLLRNIGLTDVTVAGDTRFDRVADIKGKAAPIDTLEWFCGPRTPDRNNLVMAFGSSWPADEEVYIDWLKSHPEVKAIIAPHEFDAERLERLTALLGRERTALYSQFGDTAELSSDSKPSYLILDTFGLLSRAYAYADVAYVGGGFGAGLHNINEAAVYAIPVIYGPNHSKFIEAEEMKTLGGGIAISGKEGFEKAATRLLRDPKERANRGKWAGEYIQSKLGASQIIFDKINAPRQPKMRHDAPRYPSIPQHTPLDNPSKKKPTIMKKILLLSLLATASMTATAENIGLDQLAGLAPEPGILSEETYHNRPFTSFSFNFPGNNGKENQTSVNTDSGLFITLTRDGETVAQVPADNTRQVLYQSIMGNNWIVSFFRTPNAATSVAGEYRCVIPEGFFTINKAGDVNKEIAIEWTLLPSPYMATPPEDASGATYMYDSLQDFTITFPGAKEVTLKDPGSVIGIFNVYGKNGDDISEDGELANLIPFEVSFDGGSMLLHLPTPITTPGTWKIELMSDRLTLNMEDGTTASNPEIHLFYFIPNYVCGTPFLNPAPGVDYSFPGVIEMYLDRAYTVNLVNGMGANYIYPLYEDGTMGQAIARLQARKGPNDADGVCRTVQLFNLAGEDVFLIPSPGKYRLVTAEKLFCVNGYLDYVSRMQFDYEILPSEIVNYSISPEPDSSVKEIQEIRVKFDDGVDVSLFNNGSYDYCAWLTSPTATFQMWPKQNPDNPSEIIYSSWHPITLEGDYLFTSPNGNLVNGPALKVGSNIISVSSALKIANSSNVENIEIPTDETIYTIDGLKIEKITTPGIYIIGGKKVRR